MATLQKLHLQKLAAYHENVETKIGSLFHTHSLERAGCDEAICKAGLFHSIYGTDRFRKYSLPLERRDEIRELVGDRAELLAYWNCALTRDAFDAQFTGTEPKPELLDRFTGELLTLSETDFRDLCTVHLYDWLEQVERQNEWSYRKETYANIAAYLGDAAVAAFESTYAKAPTA